MAENLATLQPQQLLDMKKQIEGDIQSCNASFNELRLASQKFMDSKTAIHNFGL